MAMVAVLIVTIGLLAAPSAAVASPADRSGERQLESGAAGDPCPGTLQALVDSSDPGATVEVPVCVYRESVVIDHALTLRATAGAEIRGTDVWSEWRREADGWHAATTLPVFDFRPAECWRDDARCRWPEQVFRDGVELAQVAAAAGPGEFTLAADRSVVLGDDPNGHTIEVATRDTWIRVLASDVRIEGFAMRGAVAPPQTGGITVGSLDGSGVDRVVVANNDLSAAHGNLISVLGGRDHRIEGNRLTAAGDLGIALVRPAADITVVDNEIAGNNTQGFDPGWEAGGIKALFQTGLRVERNWVHDNLGRGIWTDTDTQGATIARNRVSGNAWAGIFVEASEGVTVEDNAAWDNGWQRAGAAWGFGGGITISSSDHVLVARNVVAWNADGITILSQDRSDDRDHTAIRVTDNVVVQERDRQDAGGTYALAWLADWNGVLFDPASGNQSSRNGIWERVHDDPLVLFAWDRPTHRLDGYEALAPGTGDHYLTTEQRDQALAAAGVPSAPPISGSRQADASPAPLVLLATLVLALAALAWSERRRPPDSHDGRGSRRQEPNPLR